MPGNRHELIRNIWFFENDEIVDGKKTEQQTQPNK